MTWDAGGLGVRTGDDGGRRTARLEALIERCGGRVPLDVLLDDLPRRLRRTPAPGRAVHEAWRFDGRDQLDLRWWPQGVSWGEAAGRRVRLATWYAKTMPWDERGHGARVSVMDLERRRYRHVLLVRPTEGGGAAPLDVHAGGLVWHAGRLLVAATGGGLHVARVADLLRAPRPDLALGYRYLWPVSSRLVPVTPTVVEPLRYSFVALDRGRPGPALLVGEYAGTPDRTRRLARIALDPATGLPATGLLEPAGTGPLRMQGVASLGDRRVLSVSEGRRTRGSLYLEDAGAPGGWRHYPRAVPMGNEDLSVEPTDPDRLAGALLHTVTEHPTARWLVSVRADSLP